jgi:hypothetical protein
MPMHLFPPSFSSYSELIAPATRLSQKLQHLSHLLLWDSATLNVSEAPDTPGRKESSHQSCCIQRML